MSCLLHQTSTHGGWQRAPAARSAEGKPTLSMSSPCVGLADRKFRWRHDQILTQLAAGVEQARKKQKQLSKGPCFIHFLRAGESAAAERRGAKGSWPQQMGANLRKQLQFPEEISHASLRLDIVLWSTGTKQVVLIELIVPWKELKKKAKEIPGPVWRESHHQALPPPPRHPQPVVPFRGVGHQGLWLGLALWLGQGPQ
ncbi:hypothetical protein N1851_026134 [Merluccius polli]|uniref:Uncharacterized protein n=1 Tax=Merluccius polli TaxID=89951 RepID=A0AA47NUB0_MERPO|nr:hypothetical protein N1851_026134 [Merluccius polli]